MFRAHDPCIVAKESAKRAHDPRARSPGAQKYRGQRGKDTPGTNRASKWHSPVTEKNTGNPEFKVKSACLWGKNYGPELRDAIPHFLTQNGYPCGIIPPQCTAQQLALSRWKNEWSEAEVLLYRKLKSTKQEWEQFIQFCPFKSDIENLSAETVEECASFIQMYAETRQYKKRGNAKGRPNYLEQVSHQCRLKKCQGFCLSRQIAEGGPSEWLDELATYFEEERQSLNSQYCFNHDFSNVLKDHKIGTNVAEPDPTKKAMKYDAAKLSTCATINNSINAFGKLATKNILRPRSKTLEDIDTDVWACPDEENIDTEGKLPLQWHILSDQGSPELRTCQLIFEWFPGVFRDPWCHKLSNNTKNLVPELAQGAAASKSFFNGPFGTGGNQGKLRNSARMLAKECAEDPGKTASRWGAAKVLETYPGKTLQEILEDCAFC
eukprot:g2355.t1